MMYSPDIALAVFIDSLPSPIAVIDRYFSIVTVNALWVQQFGLERGAYTGKPCCEQRECRHRRFFENAENYSGEFELSGLQVKAGLGLITGMPLLNAKGELFLVEAVKQLLPFKLEGNNQAHQPKMVGVSTRFLTMQARLQQVAKAQLPVLLNGETGTGKEVAAHFVHSHSPRANQNFILVDCTLLTENLFESELFGHEKGAFTNALNTKKGLFELADQGTLFLDEIGELPLSQQPKLLRVLESGQFRRVGGTHSLSADVRIVCATHRNLGEMVKQGLFREDLYYRLSVLSIEMPALRDRAQDLPILAEHLLKQEGPYFLTQSALQKLMQHRWPGNVRELKNCLQLAIALAGQHKIEKQAVQIMRRRPRAVDNASSVQSHAKLNQQTVLTVSSEQLMIQQLIVKYQGNRKSIAAEIGVSERTLYRKISQYNLGQPWRKKANSL